MLTHRLNTYKEANVYTSKKIYLKNTEKTKNIYLNKFAVDI